MLEWCRAGSGREGKTTDGDRGGNRRTKVPLQLPKTLHGIRAFSSVLKDEKMRKWV